MICTSFIGSSKVCFKFALIIMETYLLFPFHRSVKLNYNAAKSMDDALPVFGSRISGDRCDGGVPGEKCSLL